MEDSVDIDGVDNVKSERSPWGWALIVFGIIIAIIALSIFIVGMVSVCHRKSSIEKMDLPSWHVGDNWDHIITDGNGAKFFIHEEVLKIGSSSGVECYTIRTTKTYADKQMSTMVADVRKKDLFTIKSSETCNFKLDGSGNIVSNSDLIITEYSYDYPGSLWPIVLGEELDVAKTVSQKIISGNSTKLETYTKMVIYKVERLDSIRCDIGEFRCYKVNEIDTQGEINRSWWYSTICKCNVMVEDFTGATAILRSYKLN